MHQQTPPRNSNTLIKLSRNLRLRSRPLSLLLLLLLLLIPELLSLPNLPLLLLNDQLPLLLLCEPYRAVAVAKVGAGSRLNWLARVRDEK